MFFIDMVYVRWRQSVLCGRIIIRGAENEQICVCRAFCADDRACCASNTDYYFCYHTPARKEDAKEEYATSVCLQPKHTHIGIFFQYGNSEEEHFLANIEMLYNRLLFKNGYFLDYEMRKHGYGVVVMCHALPALTQHVGNEAHDARIFLFLNWRQCRTKMKNYIISHMSKLHDVNTISTDIIQVPPTMSGHSVWEQKMFLSLRKAVCSTFNLR